MKYKIFEKKYKVDKTKTSDVYILLNAPFGDEKLFLKTKKKIDNEKFLGVTTCDDDNAVLSFIG